MKTLIVEDDFTSRLLLQKLLERYGECHIAVNGKEAMEAVRTSLEYGGPYNLICLDIMMPEMDGQQALRQIRALEEAEGTISSNGAKIVMTTARDDVKTVVAAFRELCDGYLVKPIDQTRLVGLLKELKLID